MDDPSISLRFAVMLEAYLRGAGSYMDNLIRQNEVMFKLTDIAQQLKKAKTPQERKEILTKELESGGFPSHFTIPLDPKYEATDFVVSKCKVMDSKKVGSHLQSCTQIFDCSSHFGVSCKIKIRLAITSMSFSRVVMICARIC